MALRGFRLALRGAERLNDATARRLIEALRLAERDSSFGIIEAPRGDVARWWQLKYFLCSTPIPGEDEPNLTSIFFRWVGSTTNQVGFENIFPEVGFGEILILFPSKKCLEMLFIITCFNFQQLEITFISHCLVAIELMIMCCFNG